MECRYYLSARNKLEGHLSEEVKQIWGGRWVGFARLEASGTRGGMLLAIAMG